MFNVQCSTLFPDGRCHKNGVAVAKRLTQQHNMFCVVVVIMTESWKLTKNVPCYAMPCHAMPCRPLGSTLVVQRGTPLTERWLMTRDASALHCTKPGCVGVCSASRTTKATPGPRGAEGRGERGAMWVRINNKGTHSPSDTKETKMSQNRSKSFDSIRLKTAKRSSEALLTLISRSLQR